MTCCENFRGKFTNAPFICPLFPLNICGQNSCVSIFKTTYLSNLPICENKTVEKVALLFCTCFRFFHSRLFQLPSNSLSFSTAQKGSLYYAQVCTVHKKEVCTI